LAKAPAENISMAALLLVVQSVANVANFTTNQFLGVKLIEIARNDAALYTGLAFTTAAAATAIGALSYSRVVARFGYRPVASLAVVMFGLGIGVAGLSQDPIAIVGATGASGIVFGACFPALNSMIGLESPEPLRSTIFGAGNSIVGVGLIVFPLITGAVGATAGISTALVGVGVVTLLCGGILFFAGREPPIVDDSGHD
jgi:MFS family permease